MIRLWESKMMQEIISRISNYIKKSKTDRLNTGKLESKKSPYPTIIIEENFTSEWSEGEVICKISLEVPIPISDSHKNKEEIELVKIDADEMFRPVVTSLKHYLNGLFREGSTERFLIGRDNLIAAIKQCAVIQKKMIEESKKNL